MKEFIFTIFLFIILLASIILNCIYVNSIHDFMHNKVNEISTTPCKENEDLINELIAYWEDKKILLSISVSFSQIDDLSNALDSLYASNSAEDITQLSINIELLQNAIDAIMRLEQFSIENIL